MSLIATAASSAPSVPAVLDPALPRLAEALDGSALHAVLGPVRSPQVARHDLWYIPGERCLVTYAIAAEPDGGPRPASGFLVVEVDAAGLRCRELREDAALPGLATALDPAAVRLRLEEAAGAEVERCRVVPVRYRPEQRCVVRFDLATASGPRTYFGKLLREGAGRAAAAANAIRAHSEREAGLACVPRAIPWCDAELVLTEAAPGRQLSGLLTALLAAPGPGPCERARQLVSGLGSLLGLLHTTPGVDAPAHGPADEVAELAGYLPLAHRADPAAAGLLGLLVDELAGTLPGTDGVVLGHGSFRTGQVLAGPAGLTLLDLDGLYRGDPARDIGNVLAYLTWKAIRRPGIGPALTQLLGALTEGYGARGLHLDPACLRWWQAASLVKIAGRRYRQLATQQWPLVPLLLDEAGAVLAGGRHRLIAGPVARPRPIAGPVARPPAKPLPLAYFGERELTGLIRMLLPEQVVQWRPTVVAAQVVAQASGRRAVVRCELADGDGRGSTTRVMLKAYADAAKAARAYHNLAGLAQGPFACTAGLHVPATLGWLPGHGIIAYLEAGGDPLDKVLPAARATAVAAGTAQWLAVLHGCGLELPHRLDLPHHIADTRMWVDVIDRSATEFADAARRLAGRLADAAAALDWHADVPIHFDLHPGHVLTGPTGLTVLDLDEARMGDPVFDVAHFCVYLESLGLAGSVNWPGMRREFLDSYTALTGMRLDRRFAVFSAYAWLKVARQLASGSGPWRPAGAARLAGLQGALSKGAACLDA
jgi:aminoglycoside phosphotransferase (APT) family kinase protein